MRMTENADDEITWLVLTLAEEADVSGAAVGLMVERLRRMEDEARLGGPTAKRYSGSCPVAAFWVTGWISGWLRGCRATDRGSPQGGVDPEPASRHGR